MQNNLVNRISVLLIFFGLFSLRLFSQHIGGRTVYNFLNIHPTARISGLGGMAISLYDDDLSLVSANPAQLNSGMNGKMLVQHQFYLSDIKHSFTSAAFYQKKTTLTFVPSVSIFQYGEIIALDQNGDAYGTFRANDLVLQLGVGARIYERIRGGILLKWIQSNLGQFNSYGVGADIGVLYLDTAAMFNVGLVIKNAGLQLKVYEGTEKEPLPLEMAVGVTKRLKYLPLRISLNYRYLDRWDIRFLNNEETINFLGQENKEESRFKKNIDNFSRHLGLSGELLLGQKESFHLRFGYSHLLRKELGVSDFGSFAGFSFGFGIRSKRFDFDFGRTVYHLAGGVNHIGFGIRPSDFFSLKKFN